ncbi:glycosyltransferase family protein [Mycolicibacterium arenosum]|uniref:Glycosyltransferase subfamily 4-like N-terminal domain-containing protein n=1 Tax=Mycolicibacterium arenosum TaxID=2952157 RepID=A0ABT1M3F2_9MYCO|nr:hypothetical protein [Mycolicibacterium sp. CAU 1645]MCP9273636.1 hypothetical protein [Mycolicibacterium sp. CAU 1645]
MFVASVPAAHPYVGAVVDPRAVTLLPDPVPRCVSQPGQWWPPRLLEPDYLRHRVAGLDLLHVHFGFDTNTPTDLAEVAEILDARRVPLIVTVHDLDNPHFTAQSAHAERLGVLLAAASAVVTLTDGAAAEIERRWGRRATVLPHPHVLPVDAIGAARAARTRPVVAIHAKSLRANVDPWPLLDRLADQHGTDWRLRLDLDDQVLDAPRADEARPERLDRYRRAGVDVRVHRPFSDDELTDYLTDVDVLVLPYRHGSHSGWVEACHDAGVQAVVPDCGYFHEQHPLPVFGYGTDRFDADGFIDAVSAAVQSARDASTAVDEHRRAHRVEQRRRVRAATLALYRCALGDSVGEAHEMSA